MLQYINKKLNCSVIFLLEAVLLYRLVRGGESSGGTEKFLPTGRADVMGKDSVQDLFNIYSTYKM